MTGDRRLQIGYDWSTRCLTREALVKRSLLIVPCILLLFLNACGDNPLQITDAEWTAIAQTQTAAVWTPTVSATPNPDKSKIVEWLNAELSSPDAFEQLEQTIEARYQVVGVSFPLVNGVLGVLRVDVRCECSTHAQCCNPERMFVVIMRAMKERTERRDRILEQVPASVGWMNVVCYEHVTQFQVVSAPWPQVKSFLLDEITGYELGAQVVRGRLP